VQIISVRQVVVRVETQIADDISRDCLIGVVVIADGCRAG
jgi:hypothetical protein